jgi:outer membrane protein TolC
MAVNRKRVPALAGVALVGGVLAAVAVAAETPRLALREVVQRAIAESHLVKAGGFDVAKAGEGVRKAQSLRVLPEVTLNVETGLVPEARGTVVYSPDSSGSLDDLGPFYRVELKLVQPLWTFGKIDATETLARDTLGAQQARHHLTGENVAFEATRAYWLLAAAARGEAIARSMRKDFDELQREVEKRLADEHSGVNDADLFDVKANSYAIDRLFFDAVEARRTAADALRVVLALEGEEEPSLVAEPPPVIEVDESHTAQLVARAVDAHPEVLVQTAAAQALAAKVELERTSRNPLVFIAGGVGFAYAGNRDEQDNPWVNDDYNYARIGAEIGMRWDANLYRTGIDVSEALAAHRAALEQLEFVRSKVGVEVRRALREVQRTHALLDSVRTAFKAAKSRLRLVLDNWETGVGEVDEVLDAYEKYYRLRAEEPQREYDLNVALARLGFVFGDVNIYLGWVHDGKVSL